jgi:hypothetical protein
VIVINVLLPFAAAAGVEGAAAVFERLPGEPANRVVRFMATQFVAAAEPRDDQPIRFSGALHQQGLLHIFKTTCATRLCGACPARGRVWPWREDDAEAN